MHFFMKHSILQCHLQQRQNKNGIISTTIRTQQQGAVQELCDTFWLILGPLPPHAKLYPPPTTIKLLLKFFEKISCDTLVNSIIFPSDVWSIDWSQSWVRIQTEHPLLCTAQFPKDWYVDYLWVTKIFQFIGKFFESKSCIIRTKKVLFVEIN